MALDGLRALSRSEARTLIYIVIGWRPKPAPSWDPMGTDTPDQARTGALFPCILGRDRLAGGMTDATAGVHTEQVRGSAGRADRGDWGRSLDWMLVLDAGRGR